MPIILHLHTPAQYTPSHAITRYHTLSHAITLNHTLSHSITLYHTLPQDTLSECTALPLTLLRGGPVPPLREGPVPRKQLQAPNLCELVLMGLGELALMGRGFWRLAPTTKKSCTNQGKTCKKRKQMCADQYMWANCLSCPCTFSVQIFCVMPKI